MKIAGKKEDIQKDLRVLKDFFEIYCRNNHSSLTTFVPPGLVREYFNGSMRLCDICRRQFLYAGVKRIMCPFEKKPACKRCPSVCYSQGHREFMREMMRYSGRYLITHGRLDLIFKYLF